MRQIQWLVWLTLVIGSLISLSAAQKRDPLNEKEIDQMREVADYPNKRLELMVSFVRARVAQMEQLRTDPKAAKDRPMQIHDLLEDFTSLLDEIDDNIDMYGSHKTDMRKGLKLVIEADSEWQMQLRQLKEKSPPEEVEQYSFVLTNASDAAKDSGDSAREALQEQNTLAAQKKLIKVYSERPD
jgi:hypothetical protein